jgi:TusA-related sulfurtransferase|tara:strand:+ start:803 stop:1039 length:237 start_codon:yes stop_codon:yes gene_type:complete
VKEEPHILDVRGEKCPIPIKLLRDCIREVPVGEIIHMLSDDLESKYDVPALLRRLKMPPAEMISQESGLLFIIENRKI